MAREGSGTVTLCTTERASFGEELKRWTPQSCHYRRAFHPFSFSGVPACVSVSAGDAEPLAFRAACCHLHAAASRNGGLAIRDDLDAISSLLEDGCWCAAGEGPRFGSAWAQCYVAICGVPVDTSPGFLSSAGMFLGLTFGLPSTSQWKICSFGFQSTSLWKLLTFGLLSSL